ncbi:TspO/MBR family protein [Tenacibaculum sp. IB213877]|uniref:TspO/MBR family protein n=1 Tax=Tenacibaculum sp. IB213877 TaxID=3097351 RepID=UPI002A5B0C1A|nr:TspO/MBR family protein [Tenacibaculum sp. IB213877]MDY0781418.1 TspO/MBR family protein [Tenacibaculum sp. IB213877]
MFTKKGKLFFLFLVINLLCLYIGTVLMDNGPQQKWYLSLNKAPWTPPGWVFGTTWVCIMICFSLYSSHLFNKNSSKKTYVIYALQIILNISWNYIFFNQHLILAGLFILFFLFATILYFFLNFKNEVKKLRFLLAPYIIWLAIAISLNFYILIYN